MSKFYRLMSGKMVPDETGVWTLRAQVDILQRQLAEVTAERDHLRKALDLSDALRNRQVQKSERRQWRRT